MSQKKRSYSELTVKQGSVSSTANELDSLALNRFSRQNAALGAETTAKLTKMKVLVVGLRGVGVETAKNLALQGVGGLTLVDSNPCAVQDMGVNFFISKDDVDRKLTRSAAVAPKLQELNSVCQVSAESELTEASVAAHSAMVVTDKTMSMATLLQWDEFCRKNGVSFAYCFTGGVSTTMFVDHGTNHVIFDPDGERPVQKLVSSVSKCAGASAGDPEYLLVRYESPEGQPQTAISDGYYTVTDIQGLENVNGKVFRVQHPYSDPVKTARLTLPANTTTITATASVSVHAGTSTAAEDGKEMAEEEVDAVAGAEVTSVVTAAPSLNEVVGTYTTGGILTEKKVPKPYPMESLQNKLKNPGDAFADPPTLVLTDLINFGAEVQQHIAWYATLLFASTAGAGGDSGKGALPRVNSDEDMAAVVGIAKGLVSSGDVAVEGVEVDEAFVQRFARYAGMELQAMSAFSGGVLAQEIVKCTGKFTPIPGFLHFSAVEALPNAPAAAAEGAAAAPALDVAPRNSRYDELASLYGWAFVERLGGLKYFMVGCGALGCEFMKNFALNGICCGPGGKLSVTDADRIELSNLSRQFLFREHNVGQPKSRAAGAMAKVMNENFTVDALEIFVGTKTENVFNDDFWLGLDGVCNALDNMESRVYVDTMCVKYERSLLESGTMGTSCNVDTICPHKTRTYRDGGNAAETGGVPMCTLRNFPHLTDHCIEWSRDQFELLFTKLCKTAGSYVANPAGFEEEKRTLGDMELTAAVFDIRCVTSYFQAAANPSIGSAAQLAFDLFHFLFRDKILDLQAAFPPDYRVTDEHGADKGPFWTEKKRYPTAAVFNPNDESHWMFMQAATCMFGVSLGVLEPKKEDDDQWLANFRSKEWVVSICSNLTVPKYIPVKINAKALLGAEKPKGEDSGAAAAAADGDNQKAQILGELLGELRSVAAEVTLPKEETQDFEKDDDLNFHIAFITAAANLRCDNYSISRTDFHACKIIAGKIIAAIATTTAAACGLVILELFKLLLNKPTDAFMNRQIGLAVNSYTSFTQEPPKTFETHTVKETPSADDASLPADAFDSTGKLKPEFVVEKVHRAYPAKHSVWDKLKGARSDMTLKQFAQWFETEHKLKLVSWDFVLGSKKVVADGETKYQSVSAPVYPPKPVLDPSLLPSLDLSMPQATAAIMRNAAAKPTQQYIALWKQCKAAGALPAADAAAASVAITENSTLLEILTHMAKLADEAEEQKKLDSKAISSLAGRRLWVIPNTETPMCKDLETGEEIDQLAAIRIDIV